MIYLKLIQKIITLIKNPELREKMGIQGEKLVKEKYEWQYCVDLMEKIYKSICNRSYNTDFSEEKH